MIAVSSSSRSFAALGKYLVAGRAKVEEGRVAWTSARNLPTADPQLAAKIMRATASQNVRVTDPVYHLALSFDPRDRVERKDMERVADRVLEQLRLKEHQALLVSHGDRAHAHVHILVNRIHPETGKAWDRWKDYPTIQRVLREEEHALGLRRVESSLEEGRSQAPEPKRPGERDTHEPHAAQRGGMPGAEAIRADIDSYLRMREVATLRHVAERDVSAARAGLEGTAHMIERATRVELAFDDALRRAFRDPALAKEAFLKLSEQLGLTVAVRRLRENPEQIGALVVDGTPAGFLRRRSASSEMAQTAAREAASLGMEVVATRREVSGQSAMIASPSVVPQPSHNQSASLVSAAEARLRATQDRLVTLGTEQKSFPSRRQLEERLAGSVQRLTPWEFERLTHILSGEQLNVAVRARQMVRDAILGREGEA